MSSILPLSSLNTVSLSSSLEGVSFKQFNRTYPGDYAFTFVNCLSSIRDVKTKNYTNFLLTDQYKFSDIFISPNATLKASAVYGPIKVGRNYLQFSDISSDAYAKVNRFFDHYNYGSLLISSVETDYTNFTFVVLDNNQCNIYYTKNYEKYYLCVDVNNQLIFVKDNLLSFDTNTINPQDFTYLFSESNNELLLFKKSFSSTHLLIQKNDQIVLEEVINYNISTYISSPFALSKNLYYAPNIDNSTSFVTYNVDNNIDLSKSVFDLSNNYLLHKPLLGDKTDIIVLKNQLSNNDIFANNNNLLSGELITFSESLREYSTISSDIKEEFSDELALNYVFYNKNYTIRPGNNYFVSPSSMYPFTSLNINDTKFIECGAFSYITPEHSDKVYHLSQDTNNLNGGQYLLCTWLSGSPMGTDKVWVDRYYYPDRIEKQIALSSKPIFEPTYDSYIEQLIMNNQSYSSNVNKVKFFDKISDLAFLPNHSYMYERISATDFEISSEILGLSTNTYTSCDPFSTTYPINYFHDINIAGEFSISFDFLDDGSNWTIRSNRNNIDSGITIRKFGDNILFEYKIYNPATQSYMEFTYNVGIQRLDSNFVATSINTKTGKGYFFFNDKLVMEFSLPIYEFYTKQLLYGDVMFLSSDEPPIGILTKYYSSDLFRNLLMNATYVEPELAFTQHLLNGEILINDLNLSLPCGMRNGIDNINTLNSVCSSQFKSNFINLKVKNLGISNSNILNNLSDSIKSSLVNFLPINTQINSIVFEDYK